MGDVGWALCAGSNVRIEHIVLCLAGLALLPAGWPIILLVSNAGRLATGLPLAHRDGILPVNVKQNRFYWQLYWRAPSIQPNTAILSADELFSFVGRASTAMALNFNFTPSPKVRKAWGTGSLSWLTILVREAPRLARGEPLNPTFRNFTFQGDSLDSLVIYYKSGTGRCLWVLSPEDADNPALPELTVQALPVSDLSRISPEPAQILSCQLISLARNRRMTGVITFRRQI